MAPRHAAPSSTPPTTPASPRRRAARASERTPALLPLVALCGVLVAAGMQFGNPALWAVTPPAESPAAQPEQPQGEPQPPSEPADPREGLVEVGSYQAVSQSTEGARIENIRLAAEAIDGTVIQPGETFSFNDAVGDTSIDERYLEAPIIMGDEMDTGRGGGICQVSTALYIAALKANLEIVERHPHSLVSDYAPIGLDATLVYGVMDLRLANRTDSPVVIEAEPLGQSVTVTLWGAAPPEGTAIDAVSKITDRFESDGTGQPEDGFAVPVAGTYYVAEAYRVFYKDGVKITSELLSQDTYLVADSNSVSLIEGSVEPTK